MRLLPLRRKTSFVDERTGKTNELRWPDAPATSRQLQRLNRLGRLAVIDGRVEPLTQAQAAYAIDAAIPPDLDLGGDA